MPELYTVAVDGTAMQITPKPFANETVDFEDFLQKNPGLMGERVEIVARQVRTPDGVIDLLALDRSSESEQLMIVELKNVPATPDVLLQVLRYARWAIGNEDSVKLLLNGRGYDLTTVDLNPRLVVVAPEIGNALIELSQFVSKFEFQFLEIHRFSKDGNDFAVVEEREPVVVAPARGGKPREEWGWDRFRSDLGWKEDQVSLAKTLFSRLEEYFREKGWPLQPRFRKNYVPFQLSAKTNVVGIEKVWASGVALWFRLDDQPEALGLAIPNDLQKSWSSNFKTLYLNILDPNIEFGRLEELFTAAYRRVTE